MMWLIILILLPFASCHPIDEPATQTIIQFQKDIDLVSYVQNFKNAMAEYVSSEYQNLTIHEMEEVKNVLEIFLKEFAKDLRDTVEGNEGVKGEEDVTVTDDGFNDSTFAELKRKIVEEFPDINEDVAEKIVVKLRKNLYRTRNKLDEIIRNSQIAEIKNSED